MQIGVDVIELTCKEEPHVIAAVELGYQGYPGRRQLDFGSVDILRVVELDPVGKELEQIASRYNGAIRSTRDQVDRREPDIRNTRIVEDRGRWDGARSSCTNEAGWKNLLRPRDDFIDAGMVAAE